MPNYKNDLLEKAAREFRAKESPQTLLNVATALIAKPVYCPVGLEKEPEVDKDGKLIYDETNRAKMIAVKAKTGQVFFPVFSSPQEAFDFYGKEEVMCLPLTFKQLMPLVIQAKDEVDGIVINPKHANIPFRYQMLKGMYDTVNRKVNPTTIRKGEKVHLKNPETNYNDLEAALISSGFHEEHINKIFLKERIPDLEHPEQTHWFVVIDTSDPDPKVFERIAELCKDALHGKGLEFMFTNQKLGQDIANSSRPIYEKMGDLF